MDWFDCAYLVLCEQFQVEPCKAEIEELAKAAKPSTESGSTVNEEWESADFPHELQTKGGRRIVHKSEPMAG
jgi:hypothetical protein